MKSEKQQVRDFRIPAPVSPACGAPTSSTDGAGILIYHKQENGLCHAFDGQVLLVPWQMLHKLVDVRK